MGCGNVRRRPCGSHAATAAAPHQRSRAKHHKAHAPAIVVRQNAGGDAPHEASQGRSADVEAHDQRNPFRRPLFADVGHHHGDDARHHDALQKTPEDKLRQRHRRCGQQRWNGNAQQRNHNDALPGQPLRHSPENRSGNRHSEGRSRNRHAHTGFGRVKNMRQQGQQRLRAVELKKGAHPAQRHGSRSLIARLGMTFRLCRWLQEPEYRPHTQRSFVAQTLTPAESVLNHFRSACPRRAVNLSRRWIPLPPALPDEVWRPLAPAISGDTNWRVSPPSWAQRRRRSR